MSQQGIFSIAPDAQPGQSNGNPAASPFTAVQESGVRPAPFASAEQPMSASPFQSVQDKQDQGGSIPQPRPDGRPPAMKAMQNGDEEAASPAVQHAVFEPAAESTGGPFQMDGFPEQTQGQFTEAAPVARAQEESPFVAVQSGQHDYEAAKAGLEPQQDFAAVGHGQVRQEVSHQPVQSVPAAPAPTSAMVATAPQPTQTVQQPVSSFQQLELRAIFGLDHLLDQKEIIQRARTLPGIRNVTLMGQQEASALSNFRQAMRGMGFGDSHELKLNAGGGDVDFLTEGETTIAVLHEGSYAPGVQETLIIVARELGKLS